MRAGIARYVLIGALAMAGCGRAPEKAAPPPPQTEEIIESGWVTKDTATETSVMYLDGATRTGFTLTCGQASKALRILAPNPADGAVPNVGEHASFELGAEPFVAPVSATTSAGLPFLLADVPVTPGLLIAFGDAKMARLLYRGASSETGVDEDGKLITFAQHCARLTGIEPAL